MRKDDNTWGSGYVPVPAKLSAIGHHSDALKPKRWLDHKVFVKEGVHMITVDSNKISITSADMTALIDGYGLILIQSNSPGTMSLYFEGY